MRGRIGLSTRRLGDELNRVAGQFRRPLYSCSIRKVQNIKEKDMPFETIALTGAAKLLAKPLGDLYDGAKGITKTKLKKWEINKNILSLHKRISSVQKVKTIWQIDKYVPLKSFYYPSKIQINEKREEISHLEKIPCDTNIVIQGTVGQGKSIFLRYMCLQELKISKRIPIFFELRNLEKGKPISDYLKESLDCLGFPCDDSSFDYLMKSGKLVLLLDAFDEIDPAISLAVVRELEQISQKYECTKIVITSRPDSGIENSPLFTVFKLCPLQIGDLHPLLNKYFSDDKKTKKIVDAVKSNKNNIANLLTTPLMVSLLVFSYKSEGKIPESLTEFYERLFDTLLSRHDGTKPSYERKRKSKLTDSEMRSLFDAFCFFSKNLEHTFLTKKSSIDTVSSASEKIRITCKPDDFFTDIIKITCLVLEDGFDRYKFLHKSIQEFYAASFIAGRPNEAIIRFYESVCFSDKSSRWEQELAYLSELDKFRHRKFYLLPAMRLALKELGIDTETKVISDAAAEEFVSGISLYSNSNPNYFSWVLTSPLLGKCDFYRKLLFSAFGQVIKEITIKDPKISLIHQPEKDAFLELSAHLRSLGFMKKGSIEKIPLMKYATAVGADNEARASGRQALSSLLSEFEAASNFVRHEEESISVFDIV